MIRFTVVIPSRNEGARLAACLDALAAQDGPTPEIIVVDGASTDGSQALAAARGVLVLSDPGRGPAAARNVGIAAATGDIIAFTDADCVPRFDWLTRLAARFEADPLVAGVAGGLRLPRHTLLGRMEDNDARLYYRGYITSNVAYRRDVLQAVGGFDESLICAEDYDLAWRILDAGHRIEQEPDAIVLHDPPEIEGTVQSYLVKQFWYARCDIPAHARAIRRAWDAHGVANGSSGALSGLADALQRSALPIGMGLALVGRSGALLVGAMGAALMTSGRKVARTLTDMGEGAREAPAMVAIETAKGLTRGMGTLVGLAGLARPTAWRGLQRPGPAAVAPAPPALAQLPALLGGPASTA